MHIDHVRTITRDGIHLDGSFQSSPATASGFPLDAICLIHGTGGNFYNSTLFDAFAERFLELGCSVLRVNTPGHDGISTAVTATGGRRLGAAYEIVDECRYDLMAWIDWLKQRAGPQIALIGHSLGAVKSLYTLAHEPSLAVRCVVAISPPRLSYSWFCSSPEGPQFLQTYTVAEKLVEGRNPAALLEVKLPLPFVITAAGYVEKYGPDERYNYLKFLPGVPSPMLITLGGVEVENNMAFQGPPEAIAALTSRSRQLSVATIAGADHFYSGCRADLLGVVEAWLRIANTI